jgi:uncharacterized membrane protein
MNNSKLINVKNGEPWMGLIDGVYAIIITLLVIELPALIIELVNMAGEEASIFNVLGAIATNILGYLFASILIYDLWSIHKGFEYICKPTRFISIISTFIFWLSSLIPPSVYLVDHFFQQLTLGNHLEADKISAINLEIIIVRLAEMFIIALIYFLLFTILKYSSKQSTDNNEYSKEISETTKIVYFRLLVSSVLVIISCLIPTNFIVPELPLAVLALFTLIPSDSYGKKYS